MQLSVRYNMSKASPLTPRIVPLTTALPVQLASSTVTHSLPPLVLHRPLELVHTDLSGPTRVPGTGGVLYRLTITDDFTRWRWLKLITKSVRRPS
jgi:hypothetical protein